MVRSYFKTAWRNLLKNKTTSLTNICGLAVGMAVAMLIGLWIWDELSFDNYHKNHDRIVQVMQKEKFLGAQGSGITCPIFWRMNFKQISKMILNK
jgi:hypothetical protein